MRSLFGSIDNYESEDVPIKIPTMVGVEDCEQEEQDGYINIKTEWNNDFFGIESHRCATD